MWYADEIMQARSYMGGHDPGHMLCASCGRYCRETRRVDRVVSDNFTDYRALLVGGGSDICDQCSALLADPDLRCRAVLYRAAGAKETITYEQAQEIILHPPHKFVLSVPHSHKKHHWMYAGMSSDRIALIGTDTQTFAIKYDGCDPMPTGWREVDKNWLLHLRQQVQSHTDQ